MTSIDVINNFVRPVSPTSLAEIKKLNINQWGHRIAFNKGEALVKGQYDLAIIGLNINPSTEISPVDAVRQELYQLYTWKDKMKVVDLGDIQGKSPKDVIIAFETVFRELLALDLCCVIIGDVQELTYYQFKSYEALEKDICVAVVDEKIDGGEVNRRTDNSSYIYKMFSHQPNFLKNYQQLAYQTFLVNPNQVDVLRKKQFECYRLGYLLDDLRRLEPVLRNTDMVSVDVSCLRYADAPGQVSASPNGFSAHDLCRLGRYAGVSDTVSSFAVYEYLPQLDNGGLTAKVIAQTIWHFVNAYYDRHYEDPEAYEEDYLRYNVNINDQGEEIVFIKSPRTGRWWMRVPLMGNEEKNYEYVACTEEDYEIATKREIPDRWMQAFVKLSAS